MEIVQHRRIAHIKFARKYIFQLSQIQSFVIQFTNDEENNNTHTLHIYQVTEMHSINVDSTVIHKQTKRQLLRRPPVNAIWNWKKKDITNKSIFHTTLRVEQRKKTILQQIEVVIALRSRQSNFILLN